MTHLEWELENLPGRYDVPKSEEYIDRANLTHVICNVDRPVIEPAEAARRQCLDAIERAKAQPHLPDKDREAFVRVLEGRLAAIDQRMKKEAKRRSR